MYPVYILSKDRSDCCLTADFLIADDVEFKIVVEPQEADAYAEKYGKDRIIVTDFSNLGMGPVSVRNFIREHSQALGFKRHWQLDDNIRCIKMYNKGKGVKCNSNYAFKTAEEFVERYENVGIAGFTNTAFAFSKSKPFSLNQQVYCCILFLNEMPFKWRSKYGDDVDMTLQTLSGKYCTVNFNIFAIDKLASGTMKGGNAEIYKDDGRLNVVKSLNALWPHLIQYKQKWGRPTHDIGHIWKKFDFGLIRKIQDDA